MGVGHAVGNGVMVGNGVGVGHGRGVAVGAVVGVGSGATSAQAKTIIRIGASRRYIDGRLRESLVKPGVADRAPIKCRAIQSVDLAQDSTVGWKNVKSGSM